MTDPLTQLAELLAQLPGIGPRQSKRLAFWFVRKDKGWVKTFANTLVTARSTTQECSLCKRLHPADTEKNLCTICKSGARDSGVLMVVERDADLENIEKTGSYTGKYFVLGGTTSPLDKIPERNIRLAELVQRLSDTESGVKELIFACSATTEGEDTVVFLEDALKDVVRERGILITHLGRGLSTGTELEYVDKDTMEYALKGRQ